MLFLPQEVREKNLQKRSHFDRNFTKFAAGAPIATAYIPNGAIDNKLSTKKFELSPVGSTNSF
jgi:hypothetical protein